MKTIQPKHRMTTITNSIEIASAQRAGLHDIIGAEKGGVWYASSASVALFRKMLAAGRSDEYIEFGFAAGPNPNEGPKL